MTVKAPAGRITASDLITFVSDQGIFTDLKFTAVEGRFGVSLPAQPDRIVVCTQTGGPGLSSDGVIDNVSFQWRIRGGQRNASSAEEMAWALDGLFVPPPGEPPLSPGLMGTQNVIQVVRAGGPPTFFTYDSAHRTHYTANYIYAVSRVPTA